MLAHRRDLPPVWDPGQGIRATVIGAAQFSVQISGNTILIADPGQLPLQNLPVLACDFDLGDEIDAERDRRDVRAALARADFEEGESPVALAVPVARRSLPRAPARASQPAFAPRCRGRCAEGCRWCC